MSYQALYRQYRPRTFDGVIGQEHITTILKNQVASGHIAHAYLFSGTRGTGKTTTARIFARAINCLEPKDGEPCGKCSACRISDSENPDIIELDAASNSSVDDIRALVEKARYTPMQLRTKVYIIDEAHSLASSSQAFNALLKTLEEPPTHVVFILATTEPQKLPATIRSRCQRLDFHRLRISDMVALLEQVVEKSGAHIEEEGLLTIARAADGGMRDALSLADQCLAFCGKTISAEDVYRVLGSMDGDFLFQLTDALIAGNAHTALTLLAQIVLDGRDLSVFVHDLLLHMRALLITKICGVSEDLLDCSPDNARRYKAQSDTCGEARLLRALELLSALQADLKWLSTPRPRIESTLIRIAQPEQAQTLIDLSARIEALEAKLKNGGGRQEPQSIPLPSAPPLEPSSYEMPPWALEEEKALKVSEKAVITAPAVSQKTPEGKAAPAGESDLGAQARWAKALEELKRIDILLYALVRNARAENADEGILLRFGTDARIDAIKKSIAVLTDAAGCKVSLCVGEKEAASDSAEAKAKAVFGDMLTITD